MLKSDVVVFRSFHQETDLLEDHQELHVVPGSFNPPHDGHWWLYDNIPTTKEVGSYFELSKARVGKEDLSDDEVRSRVRLFQGKANVIVTQAPMFTDKYKVLKQFADKIVFHIGIDTYERLLKMDGLEVIEAMDDAKFCVYARAGISLPSDAPRNCYMGAPAPAHLQNISSTLIRNGEMTLSGTVRS